MKTSVTVTSVFNCSQERAFKAPMLGDATKFLNGYLFQPPVIRFEEDETWGEINGYRYPVIKGSLFFKSHRLFTDTITEKKPNDSWRWELTNFTSPFLFFPKIGIGEWKVTPINENTHSIKYTYTFYSKNAFLQPINWLFMKIQYKGMMKKAIKGIKLQAESNNDFYYKK